MGLRRLRVVGKLGRWGVGGDDRLEAYPTFGALLTLRVMKS